MTDTTLGWAPAPGSVTRKNWPLALRWTWWLTHRPTLVAMVAAAGLVGVKAGPVLLVALVLIVTSSLVVWWRCWPGSFHQTAGRVLLGLWRSGWAYGVRWRTAMIVPSSFVRAATSRSLGTVSAAITSE